MPPKFTPPKKTGKIIPEAPKKIGSIHAPQDEKITRSEIENLYENKNEDPQKRTELTENGEHVFEKQFKQGLEDYYGVYGAEVPKEPVPPTTTLNDLNPNLQTTKEVEEQIKLGLKPVFNTFEDFVPPYTALLKEVQTAKLAAKKAKAEELYTKYTQEGEESFQKRQEKAIEKVTKSTEKRLATRAEKVDKITKMVADLNEIADLPRKGSDVAEEMYKQSQILGTREVQIATERLAESKEGVNVDEVVKSMTSFDKRYKESIQKGQEAIYEYKKNAEILRVALTEKPTTSAERKSLVEKIEKSGKELRELGDAVENLGGVRDEIARLKESSSGNPAKIIGLANVINKKTERVVSLVRGMRDAAREAEILKSQLKETSEKQIADLSEEKILKEAEKSLKEIAAKTRKTRVKEEQQLMRKIKFGELLSIAEQKEMMTIKEIKAFSKLYVDELFYELTHGYKPKDAIINISNYLSDYTKNVSGYMNHITAKFYSNMEQYMPYLERLHSKVARLSEFKLGKKGESALDIELDNFNRDVITVMHNPNAFVSPEIRNVAGIMQEAIEMIRQEYAKLGIDVAPLENWFPSNHDIAYIAKVGVRAWMESIHDELDWGRMARREQYWATVEIEKDIAKLEAKLKPLEYIIRNAKSPSQKTRDLYLKTTNQLAKKKQKYEEIQKKMESNDGQVRFGESGVLTEQKKAFLDDVYLTIQTKDIVAGENSTGFTRKVERRTLFFKSGDAYYRYAKQGFAQHDVMKLMVEYLANQSKKLGTYRILSPQPKLFENRFDKWVSKVPKEDKKVGIMAGFTTRAFTSVESIKGALQQILSPPVPEDTSQRVVAVLNAAADIEVAKATLHAVRYTLIADPINMLVNAFFLKDGAFGKMYDWARAVTGLTDRKIAKDASYYAAATRRWNEKYQYGYETPQKIGIALQDLSLSESFNQVNFYVAKSAYARALVGLQKLDYNEIPASKKVMLDRSGITEKDWEIFKTLPKERLDGYTIINLLKLSVDAPPKTRSTLIKLFTLQEHWVQEQISQSDPVHTAQFFGKAKPTRPETVMDFLRKEAFGLLSPTLNWFLVATRKGGGMTGLLKMFGQGLLTSILSGFVMDVAMSAMVGDVIDFEALAKASYSDQLKVAGKWFLHGGLSFWAIERFVNMFFVESYYIAAAFGGLGLSVGAATKQVDLFFNLIDTAIFLEQKEGEKQSAFEGRKARRIASITEKMEKSKMPVYLQAIWQKIVTQAVNVTVDDLESVYEEYYKRKLTKYQETFHKPMGGETVPTQKDKSGGRRWVKEQTAKKIGEGEKKKEKGRSKSQASTKGKPAPSKERGMVLEPIGG